jgi:glycosyltransferase involved in cell wall biosynthesis
MNQHQLKVIHVTTSVSRLGGGLFESVRHLSKETAKNGVQIEVAGTQDQHSAADTARWRPLPVHTFPVLGPARLAFAPGLARHLDDSPADLVHLHGVWQYPTSAVLRWSRLTRRPYIVSAHGMLEPWALQRSRFKKAVVNWLYQSTCLKEATCLRATASSEVESIRRIHLRNPVALIGNGVFVPEVLEDRKSEIGNRKPVKRALFISRVHPKKGLLDLVRAWKRNAEMLKTDTLKSDLRSPISNSWELLIVGPDEGGHLAQVMRLVQELGMSEQIRYGGEIWEDAAKWRCYREADLFVLPSYSENFGLVIAEALGCGLPVLTTRATPWQELETLRCGWWMDPGEEPLTQALRHALAVPAAELQAMGARGRRLIQDKYSWAPIGRQMAETYEWMAGRRSQPEWVV